MSQPVLGLQVQGNWVKVYDETRTTSVVVDRSFIPIPAFELGVLFESHVLAVRCLSARLNRIGALGASLASDFKLAPVAAHRLCPSSMPAVGRRD